MAGPTCEVLIGCVDSSAREVVEKVLAEAAEVVDRTLKGQVWDVWVSGRPVHVWFDDPPPSVNLAAGCNTPEDYSVLRRLAADLASALGGLASEPIK